MLDDSEDNLVATVSKSVTSPTEAEMEFFFSNLSLRGTKPTVLSLVSPNSGMYVPSNFSAGTNITT